jgi:hypothetical protein
MTKLYLFISLICITIMSVNSFTPPSFCNGLECPEYKLISSKDNIEIREYAASNWVSTDMAADSQENLQSKGFHKLYNYITGKNERHEKMDMTAPVLLKINAATAFTHDDPVFTMSFYLGWKYQSNEEAPRPEAEDTHLQTLESKRYAVISYSGYSNQKKQEENLKILGSYLKQNEIQFNSDYYFFAGYDSPFRIFNRHNEVWIELL